MPTRPPIRHDTSTTYQYKLDLYIFGGWVLGVRPCGGRSWSRCYDMRPPVNTITQLSDMEWAGHATAKLHKYLCLLQGIPRHSLLDDLTPDLRNALPYLVVCHQRIQHKSWLKRPQSKNARIWFRKPRVGPIFVVSQLLQTCFLIFLNIGS